MIQTKPKYQSVFLLTTIGMMLPFPIACLIILLSTVYLLVKEPFIPLVRQSRTHQLLGLFFALSTLSSLLANNFIGLSATVAVQILSIFVTYYYHFISKETFEKNLNIMLGFSVIHAIYAALEGWFILPPIDYNALNPALVTWRDGRADSFFFNPNYYALACAIFILIAGYKTYLCRNTKRQLVYAAIAMLNGFGMLFTLTRTILPSLLVALIVFGVLVHSRRFKKALIILVILMVVIALIFYRDIPRFDLTEIDENFDIRTQIWTTALREFKQTWLIGQGPLTYMLIYEKYQSYATQHAHNIFLDILLNYGVVGFSLLTGLAYRMLSMIQHIRQYIPYRALYALAISLITLVLVHGLLDVTIFWVQTLYIFLVIILAIPNITQNPN